MPAPTEGFDMDEDEVPEAPDEHPHDLGMDPRTVEHGPRTGESIVFIHGGSSAGWTWFGQAELLPERHVLTPDLPGYGSRTTEEWVSTAHAADDLAALIRDRAVGGRAHIVGLSLGGFVATRLLHRHPDLVLSCIITGAALTGYRRWESLLVRAQMPLWRRRWYWAAQARVFRVPADARSRFAVDGSAPSVRTNRRMVREVVVGGLSAEQFAYDRPLLAVSGERDTASIRRAFPDLCAAVPQTQTWIAPGVHHAWNAEEPDLFARMVRTFADTGRWPIDD